MRSKISVIILTFNEQLHIERCIKNIQAISNDIYVVDSFSTDNTVQLAERLGAKVVQHAWPGNQAKQFNWALDNLEIKNDWVLRLDADEYLLPELIEEIKVKIPSISDEISGIIFKRRHIFMGKWMKKGVYPVKLLRLFRYGKARSEERLMDEHIIISEGKLMYFDNDFCDHNLNDIIWFCKKHIDYSVREAAELLNIEYELSTSTLTDCNLLKQARNKRLIKNKYIKSPLFLRSFLYFFYRYICKGAFLEGKEGFIWSFIQGWWYRALVDAKIFEIKKKCNNNKSLIAEYLMTQYNIKFN